VSTCVRQRTWLLLENVESKQRGSLYRNCNKAPTCRYPHQLQPTDGPREWNPASSWRPVPPQILLLVVLKRTTEGWMRHGTAQRPGRPITQANVTRAADLLPTMPPRLASRVKYRKLWTFRFKSQYALFPVQPPGSQEGHHRAGSSSTWRNSNPSVVRLKRQHGNQTKLRDWISLKPVGHSHLC
jgi:hypothetical protein